LAKGLQKHRARLDAINLMGKDLARRAGRACELCEERNDCRAYDLEPEKTPEMDHLILLCSGCRELMDRPGQRPADHMRFVANQCWSDVVPVQTAVRRLLEPLSEDWAREALDNLAMIQSSQEAEA
jgi:protein PhnA